MSGSGRAGNGRGNNRRSFKRRDNDTQQERSRSGRFSARESDTSGPRESFQKNHAGSPERKAGNRASENPGRRSGGLRKGGDNPRAEKAVFVDRLKWIPPKLNTDPLPVPECPWCGKPIRDISSALPDRDTGAPVHFDCVAARIAGGENLGKGETLTYIGGGRFGIVCFDGTGVHPKDSRGRAASSSEGRPDRGSPSETRDFKIKKIIEWENKDKRAEWRSVISDHYSVT